MSRSEFELSLDEVAEGYTSALAAFLSGEGEKVLHRAYELGRAAVENDLGLLDVFDIHQNAIQSLMPQIPDGEIEQQLQTSMVFLEEALSPFEITHRGYRDAVELIQHVTRFASVASHEVRAPLSAILSSAGMLKEMLDTGKASPTDRLLSNVIKGASILKSRTNDMMDIANLYAGALKLDIRVVDIADFLREECRQLEPEVRRHGMKMCLNVAPSLPKIELDPNRIEQVITNLVQNATKYASDGERIDINAFAQDSHLVIQVKDYGSGMSKENLRWLASKDSSTNRDRRARGTGLGLMLCKQLVEAHHGRIDITSQPDNGCTFDIALPLTTDDIANRRAVESANR